MIYALWYGGASYSPGEISRDLEVFETIEDAAIEADNRRKCGDWYACDFRYADGRVEQSKCPAVGDDSEMQVWYIDPREDRDPYPDRLIKYNATTDDFEDEPA